MAKKKKALSATHRGYLKIGNKETGIVEVPCAVLENEMRIISHTGLYQAFKRPRKAEKKKAEFPAIISAKNLHPFIDEDLRDAATQIHYYHTNGTIAMGYDAEFLPLVAYLYKNAEKKKKLLASQKKFAAQAKIILNDIPRKGIGEWIDEVTGLQLEKEKIAILEILKPVLSENLLKWQAQFPKIFYQEVFRIHKWAYKPTKLKKADTLAFGQFLNTFVYLQLPDQVLKHLKGEAPKSVAPIRPKKQEGITLPFIEEPYLNYHLIRIMTVMEMSDNLDEFKRNFNRVFKKIFQMTMEF